MPFTSIFKKKREVALDSLLSMGNSRGNSKNAVKESSKFMNGNRDDQYICSTSSAPNVPNGGPYSYESKCSNMWAISVCHSHRNVKPTHQMLFAESMFDESVVLNLNSRLSKTMREIMSDNNILPYFIQFMESRGSTSKHLIRFCIQTDCLTASLKSVAQSDQLLKNEEFQKQFVNDSIGIFDKYLSQFSQNNINIPYDLKKEIEDQLTKSKHSVNCDLFFKAQTYVLSQIESIYYEPFLRSSYYCKYVIDILTSGTITLADVLYNNSRLASNFMEFMEMEGMKPYVEFLLMYKNYKSSDTHYEDAISIYNRFFSVDSTSSLGFSDKLRYSIKERLNESKSDCFDSVAAILVQYFQKTYLKQFIESEFYFEYLSHCISSVQTDINSRKLYHKRTNSDSSYNSDCSFVSSVGTRDCDTASTASPNKFRQTSSLLSLEQTPDSLWKRDLSGKLQITHIDKYGRIMTRLEPEPQTTSSLTKVMKKFTRNTDSDKSKEDMAWQVARMVIDDVCQLNQ